jgi:ABC-type branched-subunit amino acid transport system permease subunit
VLVAKVAGSAAGALAGAAVLAIAFLVKSGMWPLGFWLPTTYAAASPPVAAIFAIIGLSLNMVMGYVGQVSLVQVALAGGGDVVDDLDSSGDPEYARRLGGAPSGAPGTQAFWAASSSGAGEQTLEWDPEDGDWRAVVMNEDASRDITADMSIGAELDSVLWIGIGLLVLGALLAAGAALAITAGGINTQSASLTSAPTARTSAWRATLVSAS